MDKLYLGAKKDIYESVSDPYELLDLNCYEVETRCNLISLDPNKPDRKFIKKSYLSSDKVEVYFLAPENADYYYMWSNGTEPLKYSLNRPEYADLLQSVKAYATGTISSNSANLPPLLITYRIN